MAEHEDPLQGAADWLFKALYGCCVTDLQQRLMIGYNRASRLHAASCAKDRKEPATGEPGRLADAPNESQNRAAIDAELRRQGSAK